MVKHFKALLGVAALISMGAFGAVACEEVAEDACANACTTLQVCDAVAKECVTKDACNSKGNFCSAAQECNLQTGKCEIPDVEEDPLPYKYVRIDDLSKAYAYEDLVKKDDPGADIDVVILVKKDGRQVLPAENGVRGYKFGVAEESIEEFLEKNKGKDYAADPKKALVMDAFTNYPPKEDDKCELHAGDKTGPYTYVSLGGAGGYLILEMAGEIEVGDKIDVLEVGNCKMANSVVSGNNGKDADAEPVKIQVSVSDRANGNHWQVIANDDKAEGPVISGTVANLPKFYEDEAGL